MAFDPRFPAYRVVIARSIYWALWGPYVILRAPFLLVSWFVGWLDWTAFPAIEKAYGRIEEPLHGGITSFAKLALGKPDEGRRARVTSPKDPRPMTTTETDDELAEFLVTLFWDNQPDFAHKPPSWAKEWRERADKLVARYPALAAHTVQPQDGARDWQGDYDGAMSDLDGVLSVLIRRLNGEADLASAAEWVWLNYPKQAAERLRVVSWSTPALAASPTRPEASLQARVQPWMMECFGPAIAADKVERNDRFLEEALELVQASGCSKERALLLVDYVYGRPQGDINQEVGGVMITLAAHCLAHGVDMHEAGETELARIWTKVDQIRAKQATKPKNSPLPMHPSPTQPEGEARDGARFSFDLSEPLNAAAANLPAGSPERKLAIDVWLAAQNWLELKHFPHPVAPLTSPPEQVAREALARLGSMEAFTRARAVHPAKDEELLARIDYARAALAKMGAKS